MEWIDSFAHEQRDISISRKRLQFRRVLGYIVPIQVFNAEAKIDRPKAASALVL